MKHLKIRSKSVNFSKNGRQADVMKRYMDVFYGKTSKSYFLFNNTLVKALKNYG